MSDPLPDLRGRVERITRDSPYPLDAYLFTMEALEFALRKLTEPRHISGREMLEAVRTFGWERFGFLAPEVFKHWSVHNTLDFGRIVFRLVECGFMSKRPQDRLEEFRDVYEFKEAFRRTLRCDAEEATG